MTREKQGLALHSWMAMMSRCYNKKNGKYKNYGGRGIAVCDEWHAFPNFLADMGEPPPSMTLDRIDVNGDYRRANCRWLTPYEQARNKTNNVKITIDGETKILGDWAAHFGIKAFTLYKRLSRGASLDDLFKTPHKYVSDEDAFRAAQRYAAGETQGQIAADLGVDKSSISRAINRESIRARLQSR